MLPDRNLNLPKRAEEVVIERINMKEFSYYLNIFKT